MRKKVAMTLDQRYIMMIDNAYYSVNPPITEARSQVKFKGFQFHIKNTILFHEKNHAEKPFFLVKLKSYFIDSFTVGQNREKVQFRD